MEFLYGTCAPYKSLVRPILNYASSVWFPFTKDRINKVERIQKPAAQFIFNAYNTRSSSTKLVKKAQLPTLQTQAVIDRLKTLYKIINCALHKDSFNYLKPLQFRFNTIQF